MSDWEVLGIAPTRDAGAIRRAYATRLKAIKRDLDPHAFQELRGAYERVLAACDDSTLAPAPSAPRPARPAFGAAGPAPAPVRVVVTPPVLRRERTRWRDIAADAPEPPPHEAPAPKAAPREDDRTRIDAALDALREVLESGSAQQAAAGFLEIVGRIAHPVDGVSIAALAGFERAVIDIVSEGMRAGDPTAVAVARAAAEHFRWSERTRDVRGDLDPRTFAFAGFTIAEEIERAARMSHLHRSPVDEAFAIDLVGPLDLKRFSRAIEKREDYDARREQWAYLLATEGNPVAWLPAANVAWWRRAFAGPRLCWRSTAGAVGEACVAIVPFVVTLFGGTFFALLGAWAMIIPAAWLALFLVGLRQDEPAYASLQPVWRFIDRGARLLLETREIPGSVLTLRRHVVFPIYFAFFMAGFWEMLKDPAEMKPPAALLVNLLVWLAVAYAWLVAKGLFLIGHGYFERFKQRPLRDQVRVGGPVAVLAISGFAALVVGMNTGLAREALSAALHVGGVLSALLLAAWGLAVGMARVPESLRVVAWAGVFTVGIGGLVFVASLDRGVGEAAGAAGGAVLFVAAVGAILAGLAWLASLEGRLRSLTLWGLDYRDLLASLFWGAVVTVLANSYAGLTLDQAIGAGGLGAAGYLVHSAWRERRRAREAARLASALGEGGEEPGPG